MKAVIVFYNSNSAESNLEEFKQSIFYKLCLNDDIVVVNTMAGTLHMYFSHGEVKVVNCKSLNQEMEFTGYSYGFKFLTDEFDNVENCLFLNDTVFKHGKLRKCEMIALLEFIYFREKLKILPKRTMIGFSHVSDFLSNVHGFHGYINSKFFILCDFSYANFLSINPLNYIEVYNDLDANYKNNIYNTDEYNDFLTNWLHLENGWYKSGVLNLKNKKFYENKARSIIHEHFMSDPIHGIDKSCMMNSSMIMKVISRLTGFKY